MRRQFLILAAVAAIGLATFANANRAEARCYGCYVGAGVAVGLLAGAALAHGYGYPYYGHAYYGYPAYGYYRPVYYRPVYYGPRYYRPRYYGPRYRVYGPRYYGYGPRYYYYARPVYRARYYYW